MAKIDELRKKAWEAIEGIKKSKIRLDKIVSEIKEDERQKAASLKLQKKNG